jgi:hypothetical protein
MLAEENSKVAKDKEQQQERNEQWLEAGSFLMEANLDRARR